MDVRTKLGDFPRPWRALTESGLGGAGVGTGQPDIGRTGPGRETVLKRKRKTERLQLRRGLTVDELQSIGFEYALNLVSGMYRPRAARVQLHIRTPVL
jgi:hypothetical protein